MNEEQKERALSIWRKYQAEGERFLNASQEFTRDELDRRRVEVIPEVLSVLNSYISGTIDLSDFKTKVDSINKRNRLWGFKGINGQMFFNVLCKFAEIAGQTEEIDKLLKTSLRAPPSPDEASATINRFAAFAKGLSVHATDRRGAPKVGSVSFFLTYFWQIQSPQVFPVYYTSMTDVLQEYNLWSAGSDVGESYKSFYALNRQLLDLFGPEAKRDISLWDVEHAFWYMSQSRKPEPPVLKKPPKDERIPGAGEPLKELPDSYIPPVISILPRLATNDSNLADVCRSMGSSIEKVFESRIDILFRMIGYETESLGQGHGRVPDGVAVCREFHYAIVYDAKVRQQPYAMGTDERAIREYISSVAERLKKQGIKTVYFMVISSAFDGDHNDVIRSLKMDTDAREILLVEAAALIILLEARLRDPTVTLGPDGIQRLFAESGVIVEADAREFRGI